MSHAVVPGTVFPAALTTREGRGARARGPSRGVGSVVLVLVLVGVLAGASACGGSSSGTPYGPEGPGGVPADGVRFVVKSTAGFPVKGAAVYLVPNHAVNDTPFDGAAVLDGSAEDKDEPLEDAIRAKGASFPRATTDANGTALLQAVPAGTWFLYVMPSSTDAEHLPGGDVSRLAVASSTFVGGTREIVLSSSPSATSTYAGTTTCVSCHPAYLQQKTHAHRLGFAVPGKFSPLQDPVRYPDFGGQWALFLDAAAYTGGTPVYFFDYNPAGGFSKFATSMTDPRPAKPVSVIAWLWKDTASGAYNLTLENLANAGDARSPWTLPVALTYGGAVYKQRNLVAVPGRNGHYPLLQWQSEGDDDYYDTTRWVFRDYHLDWFWDPTVPEFKLPPTDKAFEGNCAACHFTGFRRYQDPVTGEWLAGAVSDAQGSFDIDRDGKLDEINVGCEVCHGPGSDHINWVARTSNRAQKARFIVTPGNLGASREIMICGRCHDRVVGKGTNTNDEPLSVGNEMLPVGSSRADYLLFHTDRKGPALSSYWADEVHSKSHHQQYSDLLKGRMHRNDRYLTTCSDCHDSHGFAQYPHHLKYDPVDPGSKLCLDCHLVTDLGAHTATMVGFDHGSLAISCIHCHQVQAAKTGAGAYGRTTGPTTGNPTDEAIVYWENDITSHLFMGVPSPSNPGVDGVIPGQAMPIPYTNSCAPCHNVGALYPKPGASAQWVFADPALEPDD